MDWWRARREKYPVLSRLARKYLSIPATSTACERTFSKAGNVVVKNRCALEPETVNAICFLHTNRDVLGGVFEDAARGKVGLE